jgi:hypothetical protein
MSGIKKVAYLAATKSVDGTTADGPGATVYCPPLSAIAAEVRVAGAGTGSFTIEGGISGSTGWFTVLAASTYSASRLIKSSTIPPVTRVRANLVSHGTTNNVTIWLSGR